ncbi:MAG: exopolysaccharide biosynthesis polyprenyl glycosylphosphotransferase [Muribaculaceae bacterium]|nr:exopolysaccharide biosynthesis polyprenyl glycosylphosphotransferase [Muribaculaceae bacterium]
MISQKRQRNIYFISDLAASAVAIFLFNVFRARFMMGSSMNVAEFYRLPMVAEGQVIMPLMCMLLFYMSGYYTDVLRKSRLQDVLVTLGSCTIATVLITFTALINDLSSDRRQDYAIFLALLLILFVCVMIPRAVHTAVIARALRRGRIRFNTVIIGQASNRAAITDYIKSIRPWTGFHTVAIFDADTPSGSTGAEADGMLMYPMDRIGEVCRSEKVSQIVLMPRSDSDWTAFLHTLHDLMPMNIPVMMPRWKGVDMPGWRSRHLDVASDPVINLTGGHVTHSMAAAKRASDVAVSVVTLSVLAVPLAVLCLAIYATTGHSPLYRQKRLGLHRRPFHIIKLRTMRPDAEASGQPMLTSEDDPRVTPIGRFLRKYRLDELPQFWNVLCGHMSVVGPRPEREYFARRIINREPAYTLLYQVRPGITSWGMVKYGYASTVDQMIERMRYDLLYVENVSMLLDLKILFYTFHTVITGKGL